MPRSLETDAALRVAQRIVEKYKRHVDHVASGDVQRFAVSMLAGIMGDLEAERIKNEEAPRYMCQTCNVERTVRDDKGFLRCPKCGWPSP